MEIIKIALLILIALFVSGTIPTLSREITVFTTFSCCIVVLLYTLKQLAPTIEYIKNITEAVAFYDMDILLKAVGVGFITQFVHDTAADSGNKTLANQMVFAGRICILMLAMPFFTEIFKIIEYLTEHI